MNVCSAIHAAGKGIIYLKCDRLKPQICRLWKDVGMKLEWRIPKANPISRLFMEERATKVILQFLKDTDIGKCSTDISFPDTGFEWD
jgi:hypothetical protein